MNSYCPSTSSSSSSENIYVYTDTEKCVNCHACISACPVKFCNIADHETDSIIINQDLCLACGECVDVCQHQARLNVDDTSAFFSDLSAGVKMVAIVAPAVAANFPDRYLQLNQWLKKQGVAAVFDVSFGAELTVKSYLSAYEEGRYKSMIAQPCPAIVHYVETYRPELLPYLSPADSPMLHTMKMIKEFYPEYRNHRIVVISPCVAKKREFVQTGVGDYNVLMKHLKRYFEDHQIDLGSFQPAEYDNPPAERAVLFSTPGGLMQTLERWNPDATHITRKIEGPNNVYHYLDELKDSIDKGFSPMLIDCLNCEMGCNGGTGTDLRHTHQDKLEAMISKRSSKMKERYKVNKPKGIFKRKKAQKEIEELINKYWKKDLYRRSYQDRSAVYQKIKTPSVQQNREILEQIGKFSEADIHNCRSCGYNTCDDMAKAIFNGINKPEHCRYYMADKAQKMIEEINQRSLQDSEINRISEAVNQLDSDLGTFSISMEEMTATIKEISKTMMNAFEISQSASKISRDSNSTVNDLQNATKEIGEVVDLISNTADQLNLLALNATIEAASAGDAGRGFAVVAQEVKNLASNTTQATNRVVDLIDAVTKGSTGASQALNQIADIIEDIQSSQGMVSSAIEEQSATTSSLVEIIVSASDSAKTVAENMNKISTS